MFNKSVINRSFVLDNQTIIIMNFDPSWFLSTLGIIVGIIGDHLVSLGIIVGIFILIGFIIRHAILPALTSDADELFELSRTQPNHYNTNGSTERGGDVTHDPMPNPTRQF